MTIELFLENISLLSKQAGILLVNLTEELQLDLKLYDKVEWCLNKDDISPQDIFDKHKLSVEKGGAAARAEVAKYCIQDCHLTFRLAFHYVTKMDKQLENFFFKVLNTVLCLLNIVT